MTLRQYMVLQQDNLKRSDWIEDQEEAKAFEHFISEFGYFTNKRAWLDVLLAKTTWTRREARARSKIIGFANSGACSGV